MSRPDESDSLLDEQIAYYRAIAPEYEDHVIPGPGEDELVAALHAFRPTGDVLELACGPGAWTARLLRHATTITAVDAAPEMLARAKARVGDDRVHFVQADLFAWTPGRRYDVVFFGSWISHVPLDRFEAFWSFVADCLRPAGRDLLHRRRLPHAGRADRGRVVRDDSPSPERRHGLPGGEGSIPPGRPRGPAPAAGLADHGERDFRALLLGAGQAR